MKRRDALKSLGALAGAAAAPKLLGACAGSDASDGGPDGGPSGITTIVTVCMENRSYDHYLGARALQGLGGAGLEAGMSNPNLAGDPIEIFHDAISCVPDPPHGWGTSRDQLDGGSNAGFVRAYQRSAGENVPPHVMGYFVRDQLPLLWSMADHYASCDAWFSSVLGPTWPNRMYLHSGQSGGLQVNELPTSGGIDWPSIHHQLSDAGVPWAYYYNDLPFVPLFKGLDVDDTVRRFHPRFFQDAANGELPPVVWIDPNFGINDDHPPHHPMLGQQFLASIYAALAASPQWKNVLLVVTYDEHGGFFDHVPPPLAADDRAAEGFDQLGFRVPTLVAGPYVKPGHVSSVVRDHTSVLKHISNMFGLEPLTARVDAADDLSELLDLEREAAGEAAPPAALPAVEIDESEITDACYRIVGKQEELERLADAGFFAPAHDRRAHRLDDAYGIADALDALGGGRIRRR